MSAFINASWGRGLVFIGLALLILFLPLPLSTPAPVARTIRVEASQYAFTPGEIAVNPGDQVTIELVSTDVVHGLSLDGYPLDLTSAPGQTARGTFVAKTAGVLRFRCSIPCGNMHPFMIGKLQIGSNLLLYRAAALGILAILAAVWKSTNLRQTAAMRNTQPALGDLD